MKRFSGSTAEEMAAATTTSYIRSGVRAGLGGVEGEGAGEERRRRPPWTNALYRREPYADNYVPPIFLERLVTNGERPQSDVSANNISACCS